VIVLLGAAVPVGPARAAAAAAAGDYLAFESVLDGRCHNLSQGGKLRLMRNTHERQPIRYRLIRYFADKRQAGRVTGEIAPGGDPVKLGCTRVDGREQRWEIGRARFAGAADEAHRSPGDLSREERIAMVRHVTDYGQCLREQSAARGAEHEDFRRLVDAASAACARHLDTLERELVELRLDPAFASRFAERMAARTIRRLLPELMAAQAR